eukprot:scaffold10699_cov48-Phaeocystis_antarctica.AAC.1
MGRDEDSKTRRRVHRTQQKEEKQQQARRGGRSSRQLSSLRRTSSLEGALTSGSPDARRGPITDAAK